MTRLLFITLISYLCSINASADIYSASSALSRGDYAAAAAEFKKLAETGDKRAQANLGYMYYAGEGVPQDYQRAVHWYRKAAVQGNKDAQYNLAVSYAFGEGVKQDLTEAAIWYRRAGEQGHVVSQYSLGISYAYGEGVPQDQKEAARWFKKAADQGYARAQVHLGSMYHTGEGVGQNYSEAARWYRMAADRGDATAQYNLGIMYRSGKGLEQNYAQAKRWFRQSADQGYAAAQNELTSLERSSAANIATRTLQTKPELFPNEETAQTTKQQVDEPAKPIQAIKEEPVQKENIVKKETPETTSTPAPVAENEKTAKKPLFSVDKKDLLTIDESQLDIAKPTAPAKKEEIVAQVEEPKKTVSANVEVEIEKNTSESSSAINNALGIPAPANNTSAVDGKEETSGGFFSKLFSSKETTDSDMAFEETENIVDETPAIETTLIEEEAVEEIVAKEDKPTAPKVKQPVEITPRVYPEDVKAKELATLKETVEADELADIEDSSKTAAAVAEEKESSAGFFSALGDFFTPKKTDTPLDDSDEIENEIADIEISEEESATEDLIEEKEIVSVETSSPEEKATEQVVETPRVYPEDLKATELATIKKEELAEANIATNQPSAIHNALGLPSPNITNGETDSSDSFFDKLFSSKETSGSESSIIEAETTIDDSTSNETVSIEETKPVEALAIQEEIDKEIEEITPSENAWAETATNESEIEEGAESSGGFFSALGDFFSGPDKETEAAITDAEEVLIAKIEEPAAIIEERELTLEVEADLSQYSISAGRRALTVNDYDEALKQFKPLAEAGNNEAQAYLGSLYYVGKGVKQDFNEAYNWYQKSAEQNNMDAQYSIGNMYLLGEGVEQNNSDAAKWYALAGEQGHVAAQKNLDNLKKLEALNRQNQSTQEALANQKNQEKNISDVVEDGEKITATDEEITPATTKTTDDKKSGLLGLLGGLFGSDTNNASIQEPEDLTDEIEVAAETDLTESSIVEPEEPEAANVKSYAAGEAPATNSLQSFSNAKQIEEETSVDAETEAPAKTDDIVLAENPESPGFFSGLFASDDKNNANDADHVQLKSSEEMDIVLPPEEEIVIETAGEEIVNAPDDAITEAIEEESIEEAEESGGLFGFFGDIFSSDKEKVADTATQELATADPELNAVSSNPDEPVIEPATISNITENEIDKLRPRAIQGDQNAQYQLGALYYSGNGIKQDYAQAALWYRRAAQQGNIDAQYSLGNMYLMGEGIGQDDRQAANWYALAADQGHTSAKHNLVNLQKTQTTEPQLKIETTRMSHDQLVKADEENTTDSTVALDSTGKTEYEQGLAYAYGDGVRQNGRSAFNLFYEAAEKGYAPAQYKVAVAFAFGEGVRQDHNKAAEWYRNAAEQGYTIAQRNLATIYLDGKGVAQDKVQALAWYQIVANSGNVMDMRRRDMLEKQLTKIELSQSQELAKQISSRLNNSNNPAL